MTESIPQLRFFFDFGAETCLWSKNDVARSRFGYAVALKDLPVPESVRRALADLCARFEASLDRDDPGGASPWTPAQQREFDTHARSVLEQLQLALGPGFVVSDEL